MTDRYNPPLDFSGRGRGSGRQNGGGGGGRGRGGRFYSHHPHLSDEQLDREPDRGPKKKFHGNRGHDVLEESEGPGSSGGGRSRGGRGGHPKPKYSDRKHETPFIPDPINAPSIFVDIPENPPPVPSILGRSSSGAKHNLSPPPPSLPINSNVSTIGAIIPEPIPQPKSSTTLSSSKEKDKEREATGVVPNKKMHKLIFRKLPATQTYTLDRFNDHLTALLRRLSLPEAMFRVDHFTPGKLSRKRGPIFSTAYVTVLEEEHHDTFLSRVPSQVSFIEDDNNSNLGGVGGQPEIGIAPYNKTFRFKEKTDKYVNTYEEDPIFLAFKQRIENPESAHGARPDGISGNIALTPPSQPAQSLEDKLKSNSLLNFLREKAAKKLSLKKAKKEKKLVKELDKLGSASILKREKEDKDRERKERRKKKRKAKKAKEAALAGVIVEAEGGGGGGASVTNVSKKKRSRKKKDKLKGLLGEERAVEGEGGEAGDAPKKITILKKDKVAVTIGGGGGDGGSVMTATTSSLTATSTVSDAFPLSGGAAPSTAKLSRREKSRLKREQHALANALANADITDNTSSNHVIEGSGGIDYHDQPNDMIPSDAYYSHSSGGGVGRGGGGGYQGRGGGGGGRWRRNYHY